MRAVSERVSGEPFPLTSPSTTSDQVSRPVTSMASTRALNVISNTSTVIDLTEEDPHVGGPISCDSPLISSISNSSNFSFESMRPQAIAKGKRLRGGGPNSTNQKKKREPLVERLFMNGEPTSLVSQSICHNSNLNYDSKRSQAINMNVKKRDPLEFFSKKEKACKASNISIFRFLMCLAYETLEREIQYDNPLVQQRIHGCALTYAKAAASVAASNNPTCTTSALISLKGIGKSITAKVYGEGLVVQDVL